ncbi:MAG: fatty acid desaturase [Armatimonadota bacterium]|nr:MAG: fatty acid desaturase [Armatimonadota bacterium]
MQTSPNHLKQLGMQLKPYTRPIVWRSILQVFNTFFPFFLLFYLSYRVAEHHWAWSIPLNILAGLFLVRIFILQHDAGHGSFFPKRAANTALGFVCSILTMVPYAAWQYTHAIHHSTSSNLDKRGVGDVYTMTLQEYLQATRWQRLRYRIFRNPLVLYLIGPFVVFMLGYRIPMGISRRKPALFRSVMYTNLGIALYLTAIVWLFGWKALWQVYLPIQYVASAVGLFLFYVQHQFEDTYWERDPRWEFLRAGLEGASYLRLPRVLQWLTGNIGFHHIHHLAPRIPNYLLEKAYREIPALQMAPTLSLKDAILIAFADLHLYDEERKHLVGFRDAARLLRQRKAESALKPQMDRS